VRNTALLQQSINPRDFMFLRSFGRRGTPFRSHIFCSAAQLSTIKSEPVEAQRMYYRMLGNTGLQVSVLSYGFWATFGAKDDLNDQQGIDVAKSCLRVARDAGINLFDNAEVYGNPYGEAERIMGCALKQLREEDPTKWRRSELIITTKVFLD
jgi:hypothetical protein